MTNDIQQHLKQYREAEQALVAHIKSTMPYESIVRVDCAHYTGFGKSMGPADTGPDQVAVMLENGNVWHYVIECVRPITEEEKNNLPKWLQ